MLTLTNDVARILPIIYAQIAILIRKRYMCMRYFILLCLFFSNPALSITWSWVGSNQATVDDPTNNYGSFANSNLSNFNLAKMPIFIVCKDIKISTKTLFSTEPSEVKETQLIQTSNTNVRIPNVEGIFINSLNPIFR